MNQSQKVSYQIGGLKGDHCRDRIEHTLSHLPGVSGVAVDMNDKTVDIKYKPEEISSEYLAEILQTLGYSIHS